MAADDTRKRLAQQMDDRRIDLRMSWDDVADGAGVSVAHLRRIRAGNAALTPMVTRGIEDALQWARGSVARILEGSDPSAASPSGDTTIPERKPERSGPFQVIDGGGKDSNPATAPTPAEFEAMLERGEEPRTPPGGFLNPDERVIWALVRQPARWRWDAIRTLRELQRQYRPHEKDPGRHA